MGSEERMLAPIQLNTELALRNPQSVVRAVTEFNKRAYEFFETEKLLQAVNEQFFNNKGVVEKPNFYYGVTVNEPLKKEKGKKSRFDRFFATSADLRETSLRTTLSVKSADLPSKDKPFDALSLNIIHSVNTEENIFEVYIDGEIKFSVTRYIDAGMNWGHDHKSFYMKKMGETRILSFPMNNPPSSDKVILTLTQNVQEILEGYAAQGYIKLPEEKPAAPPEPPQNPATQT